MSKIPSAVSEYMRKIGAKGGKNGRGVSKARAPVRAKKRRKK